MTESTARAENFKSQFPASPAYSWEVPQKPVVVRVPFALIDPLEREAVESFRSISSRGSEIGGLLFGSVSPGDPAVICVQDYELIPCDYSRGPLYRLSDADLSKFDRAIAQHSVAGATPVIGFFRSHTRKGLALDAEDMVLFDSRFRDPNRIGLLIRPYATKASSAGIFIWENGAVRGDATYLEFPFRSSQLKAAADLTVDASTLGLADTLGGGALPAPSVPRTATRAQIVPIASRREISPVVPVDLLPVAPPEPPPVQAPEVVTPEAVAAPEAEVKPEAPAKPEAPKPNLIAKAEPVVAEAKPADVQESPIFAAAATVAEEVPAQKSGKLLWIAVGALLPLILLVAFFVYPAVFHRGGSGVPAQDSSPLSLRVERTGGDILLTWNRDSQVIRTATHAVLSISDGPQHENVDMDLGLLRTGSISYSPLTSDVAFQMEVTGQGQTKTASESVRALRTRPSPMPDSTPAPAQPVSQPPAKSPVTAPGKPAEAVTPQAEAPTQEPATQEEPAGKLPDRPLRPFHAEALAQRLRPAGPTDLPDAPNPTGNQAVGTNPVSGLNLNSVAPPPTAPPARAGSVQSTSVPEKASYVPGGQIQQAKLVHKKDPEYPRLARQSGAKGVVELMATIGPDGKVKAVKVISGHPMLTKAASDAVMQWLYKPTLLNGVPVETQTQVFVNFMGDR